MRPVEWLLSPRTRLDLVAGVVDGILTALVLTAARLLEPEGNVSISLALRISAAAGVTTVFVFFVAHYADLRTSLIRAERQLNVLRHGRLASSRLGRQVFLEALAGATLAAFCSVIGALLPMLAVVILPGPAWIGCALTIAVLGSLGVVLARSFYGSTVRWALALMAAGTALTAIGAWLRIAA